MTETIIIKANALTRDEARALLDDIKADVERVWLKLYEAHTRHAWVALGYSSWAECVRVEFGMSRSRSYQILDQAKVTLALGEAAGVSTTVDITEREARDIRPRLTEALTKVAERVAEGEEGPAAVQAVVAELRTPVIDLETLARHLDDDEHWEEVLADVDLELGRLHSRDADQSELAGLIRWLAKGQRIYEQQLHTRVHFSKAMGPVVDWLGDLDMSVDRAISLVPRSRDLVLAAIWAALCAHGTCDETCGHCLGRTPLVEAS